MDIYALGPFGLALLGINVVMFVIFLICVVIATLEDRP